MLFLQGRVVESGVETANYSVYYLCFLSYDHPLLLEAYRMKFKTTEPFTGEALLLIEELSRGVFQGLLKYVQLCLEETLSLRGTQLQQQIVIRKH